MPDDREIELKFPVDEGTLKTVRAQLEEMATHKDTVTHRDHYFNLPHRNVLAPDHPFEWLRIREEDTAASITYKHFHPEHAEEKTHCDEFETAISDPEQAHKLLTAIDFEPLVTVDKQRILYRYRDELEIVLDTVDGLGHFIEIEALKEHASVDATREQLHTFAEKLGIAAHPIDMKGYPHLLLEQDGKL